MTAGGTILLTGGTGFLGSNLLTRLVQEHRAVILLKRSTSDTSRVQKVLKSVIVYDIDTVSLEKPFLENRIDIIIHCATEQRKNANPVAYLETNLLFPLALLQLGLERHAECFINTDTILDKQVNAYALSKHQFREWLKTYANKMTCMNVALELFYGPYDQETKFVTFVIQELLKNTEKIDFTKGEQKRDFIYIDDVVDAFMKIIDHGRSLPKGFFSYEVGTGMAVPVREIVTMIKSLTGNTQTVLNFGALPYREHEILVSSVDASALRTLQWQPRYSLKEGLRATIDAERVRLKGGKIENHAW